MFDKKNFLELLPFSQSLISSSIGGQKICGIAENKNEELRDLLYTNRYN
jgi:hypothetical protein